MCEVGPGTPKCGQRFRELGMCSVLTHSYATDRGLELSKSREILGVIRQIQGQKLQLLD